MKRALLRNKARARQPDPIDRADIDEIEQRLAGSKGGSFRQPAKLERMDTIELTPRTVPLREPCPLLIEGHDVIIPGRTEQATRTNVSRMRRPATN